MQGSYREIIKENFEQRCQVNPRYSLRAFARDLGFSAPRLSQVINGKKGLSESAAREVSSKLGFSENESEYFINLVIQSDSRSREKRKEAALRLSDYRHRLTNQYVLERDAFNIISDWYHFGILELAVTKEFKSDYSWIAKKLGINEIQVEMAVDRLVRLNLLARLQDGSLVPSDAATEVLSGPPSEAIKKFHKQIMEKGIQALYSQPVDEREFESLIIAIDKSKVEQAKKLIYEFRKNFAVQMNQPDKDSVYCLGLQFFRMDQKDQEEI